MIIIKVDRLIGILTILLQRQRVAAPELAEKFEVSRRTINRDIEDLCKAGVPVITIQGAGGGIEILEGYKLDKTLFTTKEMQAVLAGLESLDSVSDHNEYRLIADKFKQKKEQMQERDIYDNSGHILIDLASHYKGTLAPKIERIRNAIDEYKVIEFDYYCRSGESSRKIEPYLLVFQWSSWYVWGFCLEKNEFRLFKLNRIVRLNVIDKHYKKRAVPAVNKDLDLAFPDSINVVVDFEGTEKWRVIEEYGIESIHTLPNGKLRFEFHFSNKENFFTWILGFGEKAMIISPDPIRREFLEKIEMIRQNYQNTEDTH